MVSDDSYVTVPSYFRCPISLDVMQSPVSLCTGVTYDRSCIQRWLDAGNDTCPATMQLLKTKELVPNHTLHRLIKIWSESVKTRTIDSPTEPESITREQAEDLIRNLEIDVKSFRSISIPHVSRVVNEMGENSRVLQVLVSAIAKMQLVRDFNLFEMIVLLFNELLKNRLKKIEIDLGECDFIASILFGMRQGRLELRIAIAEFLDLTLELRSSSIIDDEIYTVLLRLIISSNHNQRAIETSLNLLMRLAILKRNRSQLVRAGGVKVFTEALMETELTPPLTEKLLKLVEISSTCKEGRNAICDDEICVRAIVHKLLKVSSVATEHAVTVLWSLCCVFGDKRAAEKVAESGGAARFLVLLQSDCSGGVRRMCGDLLRALRCNSKSSSYMYCYETKTTHIMPF